MARAKARSGKCLTASDAIATKKQHVRPCSDCPFRRDALSGWLGGFTVDQFVLGAHSDAVMDCHTRKKPSDEAELVDEELDAEIYSQESRYWQCAGVAVYRGQHRQATAAGFGGRTAPSRQGRRNGLHVAHGVHPAPLRADAEG